MRDFLRRLLGITAITDHIGELSLHILNLENELLKLRSDLSIPHRSDFNPTRKVRS